jgi:hypothetical protein
MPQARPAIRRRYSVLVKRQGRASIKTWAWEIRRSPEQLAVQLERDGFITAKAAKRAREKALYTLLESLSGETQMSKQEREACTYDTGSVTLPTAHDVNATPCGYGGYGL